MGNSTAGYSPPHVILLLFDRLPERVSKPELHEVLQLAVDVASDGFVEHALHAPHQHLQTFDHGDHLFGQWKKFGGELRRQENIFINSLR